MGSITDITNRVSESVLETQKPLVFLQQDQLIHGIRSTGRKIGRYKNKEYASMKYKVDRRAGFGNVNLFLEGSFQGEIYVIVSKKAARLTSADSKTTKIIKQYGKDIFGLTRESAAKYSKKELAPRVIKKIKQQILK
jgi:hypothetical protein